MHMYTWQLLLSLLPGIQSRLPYFEYLAVETIWLSPIYCSPFKDFGYDISDHKDIDPIFGTLEDFDDLLKDIHNRGEQGRVFHLYSYLLFYYSRGNMSVNREIQYSLQHIIIPAFLTHRNETYYGLHT